MRRDRSTQKGPRREVFDVGILPQPSHVDRTAPWELELRISEHVQIVIPLSTICTEDGNFMTSRSFTRTALPLAAMSLLLLIIAIGSAWSIRNMQQSSAGMLAEHLTSMRAAQELEFSVRELRTHGVRYLISGHSKHLEAIPRLKERIMAALGNAEGLAFTPAEQALTQRIRSGLKTFFTEYENMTNGNPKQAEYLRTLDLVDSVLANEVIEPTQEYFRLNEGMLVRANADNQAVASRITTGLVALGLCGAGGGLIAGWVIAVAHRRSTLRAEQRLRTTARQLENAARTSENTSPRGGRGGDALDDVAESAAAVLARLKRTEREALRAEQLAWVGQMAAGIAHEVRNPLMSIKLLIQAAADGRQGDRLRPRDMRVLDEEIVRLEGIISSFLDFARPPQPVKTLLDVASLLDQVVAGMMPRADIQDVSLRVDSPHRPLLVEADANQLRQVFYNLLINALDAQPGGGRIVVTVASLSDRDVPSKPSVEVRVEDDGPGLPDHLHNDIFDPFVSTKESGMGLGLSISRRIIEDHGGTIRAETRSEAGAVFTVYLPAGPARKTTPVRVSNLSVARTSA